MDKVPLTRLAIVTASTGVVALAATVFEGGWSQGAFILAGLMNGWALLRRPGDMSPKQRAIPSRI